MEGTEVIGAFLSEELTRSGVLSKNMHKTIYIVRPEFNNNSQIIFRDNTAPMIKDKLRGAEAAEKDQKAGISEDIIISDSFLTEL